MLRDVFVSASFFNLSSFRTSSAVIGSVLTALRMFEVWNTNMILSSQTTFRTLAFLSRRSSLSRLSRVVMPAFHSENLQVCVLEAVLYTSMKGTALEVFRELTLHSLEVSLVKGMLRGCIQSCAYQPQLPDIILFWKLVTYTVDQLFWQKAQTVHRTGAMTLVIV
jgi:hypothetical protein